MTYDKIYYPYPSTDTIKKFFIITNQGKKVRFGARSYEPFTEVHLDEAKNKDIRLERPKPCWLLVCEIPMAISY